MTTKRCLERDDVVGAGNQPDLVLTERSQEGGETGAGLRALAGLTGIGGDQDTHRSTLSDSMPVIALAASAVLPETTASGARPPAGTSPQLTTACGRSISGQTLRRRQATRAAPRDGNSSTLTDTRPRANRSDSAAGNSGRTERTHIPTGWRSLLRRRRTSARRLRVLKPGTGALRNAESARLVAPVIRCSIARNSCSGTRVASSTTAAAAAI